jgi:hypothetical protein
MGAKKTGEGLRNEAISAALEQAIRGRTDALYKELTAVSGLPGPRMNLAVAQAFATDCAKHGEAADRLIFRMAALTPEEARGASAREFLPVCGVLAMGARAAKEKSLRTKVLNQLHELAEDSRFRVREAVPFALARIGAKMGEDLGDMVEHWMNGYFHAAAVLKGIGQQEWLAKCEMYYVPINLLHDGFWLAHEAPRSAQRYPGYKALIEALVETPIAVALRFNLPMMDRLQIWADQVGTPEMRDVITRIIRNKQLKAHYGDEIKRITETLAASRKPPRDPTRIIQGMRGRGQKRGG